MKYFKNCNTIEEVKKAYRKLAFRYHPDRQNGNEEIFKAINNEYEVALKIAIENEKLNGNKNAEKEKVYDDDFRKIINELIKHDIEIEICGSFIWLGGNTYPIKEKIKEFGGKWSKSKKKWYIAPKWWKPSGKKYGKSMNEIRNTYGSSKVKSSSKIAMIEG